MKIVRTALMSPRIGTGIVSRPRLFSQLSVLAEKRLTLLQAPAGFGKSTLLQQWQAFLTAQGDFTAWISLDRHVSDIMSYIISALCEGVPEFGASLSSQYPKGEFVTTETELVAVVGCLSRLERRLILFIDDIQFLRPEQLAVLERLIERLPPNTHFVMASREMPNLPLARMRARGELLEIGMNDLRFTADETRQLLAASQLTDLSDSEVESLAARTEGWATGIRLATLSMSREPNRAKLIASFSGSKNVIADFFSEDVFGSQPKDIQDFLLKTCLFERFSADLCAAVTGHDKSREMLAKIGAAGLFLIHLDDDSSWYRYHGLFAGFLSRRLADLDSGAVTRLHVAASKWFYENNLVMEALDHAVKSEDHEWLASILEETCEELVYNGKLSFVVNLSEQLDTAIRNRRPKLLLAVAWLKIRNLRLDEAKQVLVLAEQRIDALRNELSDEDIRALEVMHRHRAMMLAAAADDFSTVETMTTTLFRELDESKPYLVCNLYGQSIRAQREQFKYPLFEKYEAKARALLEKSNYKFAFIAQQSIVGQTLFTLGRNDAAERVLQHGISQAIDFAGENSGLAALPALPMAQVAYERNELGRAGDLIKSYLPVARQYAFVDELLAGHLLSPKLHFADGDTASAFRALDFANSIGLELGSQRFVTQVMAEKVRLLLLTGHAERAIEVAQGANVQSDIRASSPNTASTTTDEVVAVTRVRIAINQGDVSEALVLAQRWKQFCSHRGAIRHSIRWSLLYAQLLLLNGDSRAAQRSLRDALVLAAEGQSMRIFLDEGVRIYELLNESYGSGPLTKHPADLFAYNLLSAFENRSRSKVADEVEQLSDTEVGIDGKITGREIEILTFVASGLRNKEIGDRLGLTEGSVKWYMQRIYDKVGTRRRSVAVERARQFGLLQ